MGYPMTYQRVIGRNRIADGNYDAPPSEWSAGRAGGHVRGLTADQLEVIIASHNRWFNEAVENWNRRLQNLAGDLRRLEKDAIDENATAKYIASRINVHVDVVAAVLREFMNW